MDFKRKQVNDANGHLRNTHMWSIEVDYTNINELMTLQNKIHSQIISLRVAKDGSARERKLKRFNACKNIVETDISDLYSDLSLDMEPVYYIYAHCDDRQIAASKDGITTYAATMGLSHRPFYIGKGTGDRAYNLNRNETHRKVRQRLAEFNKEVNVVIIKDKLTELDALCLESKLIDIFGVIGKGGTLVNLDEGIKYKERQERYADYLAEINTYYRNSLKIEV